MKQQTVILNQDVDLKFLPSSHEVSSGGKEHICIVVCLSVSSGAMYGRIICQIKSDRGGYNERVGVLF